MVFFKIMTPNNFGICIFYISMLWSISLGLNCYTNKDVDDTGPVINAKTGTIVGKYISVLDKKAPVFLGIPFAKPPVGEKRFQITEPIEPWNIPYIAKEKSPACMQYSTRDVGWVPRGLNFSEDCLYLNVWLPANCCCNRKDKLPVMVWLFSGGYYAGSGMMSIYDGDVMATLGDVIVVTINYRVNIFGFLNLDSTNAPGNQGLYDQYLALKWVNENIEYFGGDPNSVTLFGESAGSISVSLQMISDFPKNFFHKAIMESGNSYQSIKVDHYSTSIAKASEFTMLIGCSINVSSTEATKNDIFNCLRNKTGEELAEADNYFTSKYPTFFEPSYGNECEDCLKYFSGSPMVSIQSGDFHQVPTLIGNNKNEGTLFMVYTIPRIFRRDIKPRITADIAKQILRDFFYLALESHGKMTIDSDKVFHYYVNNIIQEGPDAPLHTVSRIYGDYILTCGNMFLADHIKDPYFYLYTHRSRKDPDNEWLGVPHFSEVPYVFGQPIKHPENYTVEDIRLSRNIIQKFTSFAHYGYPVTQNSEPDWPQYSSANRRVYELNGMRKRVMQFPSQKACIEVWNPLFEEKSSAEVLSGAELIRFENVFN